MKLTIDKLKPGMVTAMPVYNKNRINIISEGKIINQSMIDKFYNYDIKEIEVVDFEQENINTLTGDLYTTISQELKNHTIESLEDLNITEIINNANKIVNTILNSKDFNYSLLEYKEKNYVYSHCVRVAAFACVLAKYYNQNSKQTINLENLSVAALVHDLGKTLKNNDIKISFENLPKILQEKLPGITDVPKSGYDDKFEQLYTFCLLNKLPDINMEIKIAALLSGEDENSTGPLKVSQDIISSKQEFVIISKIIRLCSIYDDILKQAIENNQPLENISAQLETYSINGILNEDLTNLFLKHIPLYSVGVKVKLSDNRYGIVIETFTEKVNNYKPKVKIIPTEEIVDLRNETSITVREICGEEISFAELVIRQIIDMNNGITNIEQIKGKNR